MIAPSFPPRWELTIAKTVPQQMALSGREKVAQINREFTDVAAVIEHDVEDDVEALGVSLVDECPQLILDQGVAVRLLNTGLVLVCSIGDNFRRDCTATATPPTWRAASGGGRAGRVYS